MSVSDTIVRQLHFKLIQISELQSQIDRGPRQIQAAQIQVDAAKDALLKCKESIKQKKLDADRKQLQQREREAKLHDLEGKLNAAKANREYQTLKEQIAADTQVNSVLSDEIFETLEEIDALQSSIPDFDERVQNAEAEKAKVSANIEKKLIQLRADLASAQGALRAIEETLPSEFLTEYQRLVASRGIEAMAAIDGNSCGGCYTTVPPRVQDRLRLGQPTICPSCGRMLYTPDE